MPKRIKRTRAKALKCRWTAKKSHVSSGHMQYSCKDSKGKSQCLVYYLKPTKKWIAMRKRPQWLRRYSTAKAAKAACPRARYVSK